MVKISNGVKAISLIILVLFLDQLVKIEIKTTMTIGESITIFGNWFFIKFIENPGMAFGLDIPGKQGKPILTIFRIIAVIAIGWYLRELVIKQAKTGLVLCVALIFAGAMGNIIDSVFYGVLFNESTYFSVAQMFPKEGGYGQILHGRVVDMLYFPILQGTYPNWFPVWRGQEFIFFRPIFNIADSSISIGIVSILLFQKSFFHHEEHVLIAKEEPVTNSDQVAEKHE
jgi:signal peptidase II